MDSCLSDPTVNKEFPDTKQRYAVCVSRYEGAKKAAAFVIATAHDEFIYAKTSLPLPQHLIDKMKSLPESGIGYHKVRGTLTGYLMLIRGIVRGCDTFETDDDLPDDAELMDLRMDD